LVQTDEERKAKKKKRESTPERKAIIKKNRDKPERKAKLKDYNYKYNHSARGQALDKARRETDEYKEKTKKRKSTDAFKSQARAHKLTSKFKKMNKITVKKYKSTPEFKAKQDRDKLLKSMRRAMVLLGYSRRHSNSNVPCCRCCGENSFVEFLAIDHIAGKYKMDSIPELVKIGYSSKLKDYRLIDWILEKDFPKGFQILCHNCNMAKGVYGKCPHEE
jgi:hypothetical protein